MPAALRIDWEVVRQVAVQIGVREAARQFELNEDAVCKRSYREGWLKPETVQPEAQAVIERVQAENGLSTAVRTKGSDVLLRLRERSKLRAAKVGDKGLRGMQRLQPEGIIDKASNFKALVDGLKVVHEWGSEGKNSQTLVNINLLGVDPGSIQ